VCIKGGQQGGRSTIQAGPSCCIIIQPCLLTATSRRQWRPSLSRLGRSLPPRGYSSIELVFFQWRSLGPKPPNKWPSQGFQCSAFFFLIFFVFGGNRVRPTLHKESRPRFNSNQSSIPIDAKVEISPKGLYTRRQGQGSTQINQAFLLIQKLKSTNPNGLYTRSQGQCSTQLKHSYWCKSWNRPTPRGFTLGVKAKAQLKSSIPIGAKNGIDQPQWAFTLGVMAKTK
jgi:hypothetical protein